jgi:ketosteroid isomerase-like protein
VNDATLLARVDRLESLDAIRQLPCRYALAVDARDVDAWLALFVDDVDCGRRGTGREALRTFIEPGIRTFYRSIHQVCGHVIDFADPDHATGTVYCRAEHEAGGEWVVMAIIYYDTYERRENRWYFVKRQERHWYSADILRRPEAPFQLWERWAHRLPDLPEHFPTWQPFWAASGNEEIAALTTAPISRQGTNPTSE